MRLDPATLLSTLEPSGPLDAPPPPAGRVGGRYALGEALGQGGGGAVFAAWDTLRGEDVVVKLVPRGSPGAASRARRERAALRRLGLPGVVPLLDDGELGDLAFLVMPRVPGLPFPGVPTPAPWAAVRQPAWRLLEVLAEVHRAGVLHRDLKPSNLLVHQEEPVLLDFGVATGSALAPPVAGLELTPTYAAPERLAGEVGDARADLYAVGMLLRRSVDQPPPAVEALIERLLQGDPSGRPQRAEEVLDALRAAGEAGRSGWGEPGRLLPPRPRRPADLERVFAGPEPFWRSRSAPALALFTQARTHAAREALLLRWVRAGVARWEQGRLRVQPGRLEAPGGDDALVQARALAEAGRLGAAAAQIEALLERAWEEASGPAPEQEHAALDLLTRIALAQEALPPLERALVWLDRAQHPAPWREDRATLLHAWRAASRGEGARALGLVQRLAPLDDPELECWRAGVHVAAARGLGLALEEEVIQGLRPWAGEDPTRRGRWLGWLGNLRYRQGRYEEAVRAHLGALRRKARPDGRLSSRLNVAAALLELPALGRARAHARLARAEAARLGHPGYEARAARLARAAGYRAGRWPRPWPEALEAAAALGPHEGANWALLEAGIAWRRGDLVGAGVLAARAARGFEATGAGPLGVLCRALAWRCADPREGPEGWALIALAQDLPDDFAVQALGLLAAGGAEVDRAALAALAARWPPAQRAACLDLLSPAEAVAWSLHAAPRPTRQPGPDPAPALDGDTMPRPPPVDLTRSELPRLLNNLFPAYGTPQSDWGTTNLTLDAEDPHSPGAPTLPQPAALASLERLAGEAAGWVFTDKPVDPVTGAECDASTPGAIWREHWVRKPGALSWDSRCWWRHAPHPAFPPTLPELWSVSPAPGVPTGEGWVHGNAPPPPAASWRVAHFEFSYGLPGPVVPPAGLQSWARFRLIQTTPLQGGGEQVEEVGELVRFVTLDNGHERWHDLWGFTLSFKRIGLGHTLRLWLHEAGAGAAGAPVAFLGSPALAATTAATWLPVP